MDDGALILAGERMLALASGALLWPDRSALIVGDLHLGRAARVARLGGTLLPPYDTRDTLLRLDAEVARHAPRTVISLGDSFDDDAASTGLGAEEAGLIATLAQGRDWIWVTGNHDPAPRAQPGQVLGTLTIGAIVFRHIAGPEDPSAGTGEISAHYHPKARLDCQGRVISRPCFLCTPARVILPAFGSYTGGLDATDRAFDALMTPEAMALMTGQRITRVPRSRLERYRTGAPWSERPHRTLAKLDADAAAPATGAQTPAPAPRRGRPG